MHVCVIDHRLQLAVSSSQEAFSQHPFQYSVVAVEDTLYSMFYLTPGVWYKYDFDGYMLLQWGSMPRECTLPSMGEGDVENTPTHATFHG